VSGCDPRTDETPSTVDEAGASRDIRRIDAPSLLKFASTLLHFDSLTETNGVTNFPVAAPVASI
jgi:hypothetical protein